MWDTSKELLLLFFCYFLCFLCFFVCFCFVTFFFFFKKQSKTSVVTKKLLKKRKKKNHIFLAFKLFLAACVCGQFDRDMVVERLTESWNREMEGLGMGEKMDRR